MKDAEQELVGCDSQLDFHMRRHGTLTKWNDDRGFGFISTSHGNKEIFVHVSAFPREGGRPRLNELVSFETETGPDRRLRAVNVMRPGQRTPPHQLQPTRRPQRPVRTIGVIFAVLAVAGIGAYIYSRLDTSVPPPQVAPTTVAPDQPTATPRLAVRSKRPTTTSTPPVSDTAFNCDGRTRCSQMTSCEEARYFLQNCPNTQMDGDSDGEPCEQQWCK